MEASQMKPEELAFYNRHFPGVRWVQDSKLSETQKLIESQAAEIERLNRVVEQTEKEREGYRLLALLIYDWVCRYRDAKMNMYGQGGDASKAAFNFLPASEGAMEGFVREILGTPYNASGLTESVNDVAKTIKDHLAGKVTE